MTNAESRVVLVTGASRGVGKGTALALANENSIIYVTARSRREGETGALPGTLDATVEEVKARGARCIGVACDHSDDQQIESLIDQIIEQQGRLDILVNNVYQVPDDLLEWKPFWERPVDAHWSAMVDLGLRAHYVASRYVAPHMVKRKSGMIVTIASPAARAYIHSVIYGIGKAGKDKMTQDMAKELAEYDVAAIGLWPGIVRTERLQPAIDADALPDDYLPLVPGMESPEFTGRVIDAIHAQDKAMQYSGRSWWNSELARALGVKDIDGKQPESYAPFMGEPIEPIEAMIK